MDAIKELKKRVAGMSYREAGRALGVSYMFVYDVLHGRRAPGPKLLKALGIERTVKVTRQVTYRKIKKEK